MIARALDLLLRLSPRERLLLACAGLVILLGLGFGLLLPLQERRLQAETRLAEAQALEQWIAAQIREKQSLNIGKPATPADPIGTSGVERGLIEARLRPALSALSTQGDGAIDLRFDRVDFIQLGTWLSAAHPGWGYQIDSFRLEALPELQDAGRVAAWISLIPAGQ
ncbi:type II secretion system protein GspM [Pseudophaeobacter sp.]|uniref:type II secretion system protein GspM n=1 Tax=Pseudophaeobacter sp. TaxID=1971739 RepID=UPI003299995B